MERILIVKNLMLIFFLLFVSTIAKPQSGWFQQQSSTNNYLSDVLFINSQTGWAAGDSGTILKTTNAGLNWVSQTSNTTKTLHSIFFLDENTGWVAGGTIYYITYGVYVILKTTNAGVNWTIQLDGMSIYPFYYLSSIFFINPLTGWAVGCGGNGSGSAGAMHKTTNGGLNWNYSEFLSSEQIYFTNDSTGWIIANYSGEFGNDTEYVLKTCNGGSNWNNNLINTNTSYFNMHFINSNTGYVIGNENPGTNSEIILMKTINAGTNWTKIYTGFQYSVWNVFFVNETTGWVNRQQIKKTTNGGYNWIQQLDLSPNATIGIYFINDMTGWVVGGNGLILKTVTGGVMNVNQLSNEIPNKYSLHQNFPNPFNPSTKIRFDLHKNTHAKLIVSDALGRELATLVDEELRAGSYEVDFNGSDYPSGVYFYRIAIHSDRLETNNFIETKRMVLVK